MCLRDVVEASDLFQKNKELTLWICVWVHYPGVDFWVGHREQFLKR